MTPESALKEQIVKHLNALKVFYLRINSGVVKVRGGFMHLAPEGTADFCVYTDPITWLELKAPGQATAKKRQEAQAAFGEKVRGIGHRYFVVKSVDELKDALEGR